MRDENNQLLKSIAISTIRRKFLKTYIKIDLINSPLLPALHCKYKPKHFLWKVARIFQGTPRIRTASLTREADMKLRKSTPLDRSILYKESTVSNNLKFTSKNGIKMCKNLQIVQILWINTVLRKIIHNYKTNESKIRWRSTRKSNQ